MYDNNMETHYDLAQYEPLARACKALAHPARLALLRHIAERESCICGELVTLMPLSQATVSQHLKVLKEAGLISGTIDGPKSCYCVNSEAMARLRGRIEELFGDIQSCC